MAQPLCSQSASGALCNIRTFEQTPRQHMRLDNPNTRQENCGTEAARTLELAFPETAAQSVEAALHLRQRRHLGHHYTSGTTGTTAFCTNTTFS